MTDRDLFDWAGDPCHKAWQAMGNGVGQKQLGTISRPFTTMRSGFTLIELLIVMLVLASLAGLTYGYIDYARMRARISGTEALVQGVTTAMVNHQMKSWSYQVADESRVAPIWDVNRDGLVDGDPVKENALVAGTFIGGIVDSGYRGFFVMAGNNIPRRNVDEQDRVIDAWGQVLRIAYARQQYGANGFGVWSLGPDGLNDTTDDIRSWEMVRD